MPFSGTFKLQSSENFEEFLKAAGASAERIEKIKQIEGTIEVNENNGHYVVKTLRRTTEFDLNKEFEDELPTGEKVKNTVTKDGDKLIHNITTSKGKLLLTFDRKGDTLTLTINPPSGVSCKRIYKLQ